VVVLVRQLLAQLPGQKRRLGPSAKAVMEVLTTDPLLASLHLELALTVLPERQLADLLINEASGWRLDVIETAVYLLNLGLSRQVAEVTRLESRLAAASSPVVRRLGLALLIGTASRTDWSEERLERLRRYRQDADPMVAATAQLTLPPEEEGGSSEDEEFEEDEDW
jgi:hypothetical protein